MDERKPGKCLILNERIPISGNHESTKMELYFGNGRTRAIVSYKNNC